MKRIALFIAAIMLLNSCQKEEFDHDTLLSASESSKKNKAKSEVRDVDGNIYKTVLIGNQLWMAENLKTTRLSNKAPIPNVADATEWVALTTPGYGLYVDAESPSQDLFVPLYNWYAVNSGKLCPSGWHVPSDVEWTTMTNYLISSGYGFEGSGEDIAKSLASTTSWAYWATPGAIGNDLSTNNSSGFTAIPTLYRVDEGYYGGLGYGDAHFWTSTESGAETAWNRDLFYHVSDVIRNSYDKNWGFSVRCVKN